MLIAKGAWDGWVGGGEGGGVDHHLCQHMIDSLAGIHGYAMNLTNSLPEKKIYKKINLKA